MWVEARKGAWLWGASFDHSASKIRAISTDELGPCYNPNSMAAGRGVDSREPSLSVSSEALEEGNEDLRTEDPAVGEPGPNGVHPPEGALGSAAEEEELVLLPVASDAVELPPLPEVGETKDGLPFCADDGAEWLLLIKHYEAEAKTIGADPRSAHLYLEIGRIWEENLAKPRNAAMAYQRAFNLDPHNKAVLHASRRLFTIVGKWAMVVQILGYEIDGAEDDETKATLYAEKGMVLGDKLKSPEEAQSAFREALNLWPAEPLALDALERFHLQHREYDQLYGVYFRALEATRVAKRRLPLLLSLGQLAEDRLEDASAALGHYREVLEVDPGNRIALAARRRLALMASQFDELITTLTLSADAADKSSDSAQYLLAAARIQRQKFHAADKAVMTLLKALEYAPEDLAILKEIEFLYEENQRYDEVVKVLRREVEVTEKARERVPVLFKLASLLDERMDQPEEAIPVLQEAVSLMPDYVPATQALGRLLEKTERWVELTKLFEGEAEAEGDKEVQVIKLFKMAEILHDKLDKDEEAKLALKRLLALKADYAPGRKLFESILQKQEAWEELAELYEAELSFAEDRDHRVFLLSRIGSIAEEKLQDFDRAWSAYERVLEISPQHLHAIRTLVRIAQKREAWRDLLRISEREVEAAQDQSEVVRVLHRIGSITEEHLSDIEGAAAKYEQVLSLAPTYLPALRSLGRLYHRMGRWEDLVSMYRREAEVSRSDHQAVALLFRMGAVYLDYLGARSDAARCYQEVLERQPENLAALRALRELYAQDGEHEPLVEVLLTEARTLDDVKERSRCLVRAAEITEEKLLRADKAAELHQEVLRLGQSFDASIRALVRIYSKEGMWEALSQALRSAAGHAQEDAAKAAILVRLAEVMGDHLGKLEAASECLEDAHKLSPDDRNITGQLERTSIARRDWDRAVTAARALADSEEDPSLFASRQVRLAAMQETQLEPSGSGAESYRRALQSVPDHPVATRALEVSYLRARNWPGLAALYEREAVLCDDETKKAVLFCRAGGLLYQQLEAPDLDRVASLFQRALELEPDSMPALLGLRKVSVDRGDVDTSLDCLERETQLVTEEERRRELIFASAEIYEDQKQDLEQACSLYEELLEQVPTHRGAYDRLRGIYDQLGKNEALYQLSERRARALTGPNEQALAYGLAGQIALERLKDEGRAIDCYKEVLARDEANADALVRLGPLLMDGEEWDQAIDVFQRTLAISKDPEVQFVCFRSLGVIYQEQRQDLVKCVQSFQAALRHAPEDRDCFRRLVSVYREANDWNSAINVLLRLVDAEPKLDDKVATLLELSTLYETGVQDIRKAIVACRKALELEPTNDEVALRLAGLFERVEDWKSLAELGSTFMRGLPKNEKARALPLQLKLADVYETKLNDPTRAITSLLHAAEAAGDAPEALVHLAKLYAKSEESFPQAIDTHRRLLAQDPFRVESYHEMHRMFEERGQHDKAFVTAEVLVFLQAHVEAEFVYYREHIARVPDHPGGQLSATDHKRCIVHPLERGPVRELLEVLSPESARAFPGDLGRYKLNKSSDRHGPKSALPLRKLADEIALALGAPAFDLWVTSVKQLELSLMLENERPPALIAGSAVGRRIKDKDRRFMVARELERLKGGHQLLGLLSPDDFEALLLSAVKFANPRQKMGGKEQIVKRMQDRLARGISGKIRRQLAEIGKRLEGFGFDMEAYLWATRASADRAGLALTNDIEVAVRNIAKRHPNIRSVFVGPEGAHETIGRIPEVRDLLAYAVSEDYFAARSKLGFSIQG